MDWRSLLEKNQQQCHGHFPMGKAEGVPGPTIVGLSEIENRMVVEDLINSPNLKSLEYDIVHYDSPRQAWGRCWLNLSKEIFHGDGFPALQHSWFMIMKQKNALHPRPAVVVSGLFDGEPMHFIVNHWPSRRGG